MRERSRAADLAKLVRVQRAQRLGAEVALAEARDEESRQRSAEEEAARAAAAAGEDWRLHVGRSGFSPEYGRALGERLLSRIEAEAQCAARTAEAAEASERRQGEWQRLEARVRGGERSLGRLARKAARRTEERRNAALADRVTSLWSRG
jgi:hypothetical protein